MLRHLKHQTHLVTLNLKRVEDGGEVAIAELDVDDGTDDLRHPARLRRHRGGRGHAG